jgi:GAF domain-containing protein/CheY-like chemotaxis protein
MPSVKAGGNMTHVLVVDDDEFFAHMLADRLNRASDTHLAAECAANREQALSVVTDSPHVFDVFLLDQQLAGDDGIELMVELRQLSPDSDAIIISGAPEGHREGQRAYQQGAHRYLAKPFDIPELLWIIRSLSAERSTRRERHWLGVVADLMEEARGDRPLQEVADLVVRAGQRLGFARARLWQLLDDRDTLRAVAQAGNKGMEGYQGFTMALAEAPGASQALAAREPHVLEGVPKRDNAFDRHFRATAFEPPTGEWAVVPLFVGDWCFGVLVLDNADRRVQVHEHDRRLLGVFARYAGAVLLQSDLFETERRRQRELERETERQAADLENLHRLLTRPLEPNATESDVAKSLLEGCQHILGRDVGSLSLRLRDWVASPDGAVQRETRDVFWLDPAGDLRHRLEPDAAPDPTGTSVDASAGQPDEGATSSSTNVVDMPIMHDTTIVGDIRLVLPAGTAVDAASRARLTRLAAAGALAFDIMHRQEHLRIVLRVARAVRAAHGMIGAVEAVVDAVREMAPGLSALTLWYREPGTDVIRLGPSFGVGDRRSMDRTVPDETTAVWRVLNASGAIWASDVRSTPELYRRFAREEHIESCAALQLRAETDVVGAVFFSYRQHHEWSGEEQTLLDLLAELLALSVRDHARLEADERKRKRLEAALDVAEAVGTTLDLDTTLTTILFALRSVFEHTNLAVLTYNRDRHDLEFAPACTAFYPIDMRPTDGRLAVSLDDRSIASRVATAALASGAVELQNVVDVQRDADYLPMISSTRSQLSITLMSNRQLLGALVLESPNLAGFTLEDEDMVRSIASQVSSAIDRARKTAEISRRATTTGMIAWAADVAHDLNREVGAIRNRAYWIKERSAGSPEVWQAAQEIDDIVASLAAAVPGERLGATADQSAPTYEIDPWLRTTVTRVIEARRPDGGVATVFALDCPGVAVRAPESALQKVIRHLVRNAINAMSADDASRVAMTITVRSALRTPKEVELRFEDSGPGVPDNMRDAILQRPIDRVGASPGYGLMIVRALMEDVICGSVRLCTNADGRVNVFVLTLPVHVPAPAAEVADGSPA